MQVHRGETRRSNGPMLRSLCLILFGSYYGLVELLLDVHLQPPRYFNWVDFNWCQLKHTPNRHQESLKKHHALKKCQKTIQNRNTQEVNGERSPERMLHHLKRTMNLEITLSRFLSQMLLGDSWIYLASMLCSIRRYRTKTKKNIKKL